MADFMIEAIPVYNDIKEILDTVLSGYVPVELSFSVSQSIRVRILSANIVPNPASINTDVTLQVKAEEEEGPISVYQPIFTGTIISGMEFYQGHIPNP